MTGKTLLISQSYEVYAIRSDDGREEKLWECDTLEEARDFVKVNKDSIYYSTMHIWVREVTLTKIE
jgi:hypothetical protein